jgi:hypothetical protein
MVRKIASFDKNLYRDVLHRRAYKVSEVEDKIEKIAADIVKFKDDDNEAHLWEIQSSDDGDYIVALYDTQEIEKKADYNPWKVVVDEKSKIIDVYYENDFVKRFASNELPIPESEFGFAKKYFAKSLATNKTLSSALIKSLPTGIKSKLAAKYSTFK